MQNGSLDDWEDLFDEGSDEYESMEDGTYCGIRYRVII